MQQKISSVAPTQPNVVGFCAFITDGERHYGCRGIGPDYNDFYSNFIRGTSYKSTSNDFPWDYFVFSDIADEQKFLKKYSSKIDYQL